MTVEVALMGDGAEAGLGLKHGLTDVSQDVPCVYSLRRLLWSSKANVTFGFVQVFLRLSSLLSLIKLGEAKDQSQTQRV